MATGGRNFGTFYTAIVDNVKFTLPEKYQDLAPVGQGTFGSVIRAKDTETDKLVAIKRILTPFETKIHAKRTYRELRLLMYLNHRDANVVQLYDVFTPDRTLDEFRTLYFVFNYANKNLDEVIKGHILYKEDHIKWLVYSLLRGLKFIHSAGILHRDLKPMNIGVNIKSYITILDFGLARLGTEKELTEYVVSRWWRAPEVYRDEKHYSNKIDVWSVGCMMAEMIQHKPLFKGTNYINQLDKILDIIGTPPKNVIDDICTPHARDHISKQPYKQRANFQELFGYIYGTETPNPIAGISSEGIKLLEKLLEFDYRERLSVEDAIAHPYLEECRDPDTEWTIAPLVDEHEDKDYTTEQWKSLIFDMIQGFQPPVWATEKTDDDDEDSITENQTE